MKSRIKQRFAVVFVLICAGVLCSQPSWQERVGKQPDGSFLLSNGWKLKPVHKLIVMSRTLARCTVRTTRACT